MTKRNYFSPVRSAAANQKREQIIEAVLTLLRDEPNFAVISLDAVAKTAKVTRLTVYNQFGSRRGLLEAVFDYLASQGGLHQIREAAAMSNPRLGLNRLIEIFCAFWSSDEAVGRLHDTTATDPEFAEALNERNERRRSVISIIVMRIAAETGVKPCVYLDVGDLIYGLTSYAMFRMLRVGRKPEAVCRIIKSACDSAIESMGSTIGETARLNP